MNWADETQAPMVIDDIAETERYLAEIMKHYPGSRNPAEFRLNIVATERGEIHVLVTSRISGHNEGSPDDRVERFTLLIQRAIEGLEEFSLRELRHMGYVRFI